MRVWGCGWVRVRVWGCGWVRVWGWGWGCGWGWGWGCERVRVWGWDWTGFDSNTYDRFRPCRTHQARLESFIAGESILNRKKRESNGSQQRQSNSYSALIRRRDSNRNVISKGEIEQGSIPTLTTGFVLVGLIRQDWNRSLQENQFSIERREKAMEVNKDNPTAIQLLFGEETRIAMSSRRVRLNRVRFQHLRPVSSLSDSSGKTGIVHCRRINSQSKEERKQWKSTKTIQQLFSSYSEKRLESQCHLEGWDWTGFDSNTYDRFRPCRTHQARLESFIAGESILNRKKRESNGSQQRQSNSYSALIRRRDSNRNVISKGEIEQGSIPTLTTGFVLVGLIRQDWNRSLQENQFSIERREKAMEVNKDNPTAIQLLFGEETRIAMSSRRVRLNRVRFQHLRPVSSLSDSSGKTGIVHCRRINSQSKEERKQWKSTKTIQQLFSSYSEKRLESQCHLKGEIEQGSIPTLTTGFVLVGLIRQDWNRSLQENQFSIETREKAMKVNAEEVNKDNPTAILALIRRRDSNRNVISKVRLNRVETKGFQIEASHDDRFEPLPRSIIRHVLNLSLHMKFNTLLQKRRSKEFNRNDS